MSFAVSSFNVTVANASVISAVLATLLAIHAGFTVVIATALALYALTLWVFPALDQQTADQKSNSML